MYSPVLVLMPALTAPAGAAADTAMDEALVHPGFAWRSIASDGVRFYYQPGSIAEGHRIMLLRSAVGAVEAGREFLDLDPFPDTLRVLYLNDREEMK